MSQHYNNTDPQGDDLAPKLDLSAERGTHINIEDLKGCDMALKATNSL